jgi:hypothetical protein
LQKEEKDEAIRVERKKGVKMSPGSDRKRGSSRSGHAGGQLQVVYRLDKAEIVTYRESRVTFRGIMIHYGMMLFIQGIQGILVYTLHIR